MTSQIDQLGQLALTSKIVKLHKKFKYVLSIFVKYNTRFFILNEGESDV